jgi:hypothetical protein
MIFSGVAFTRGLRRVVEPGMTTFSHKRSLAIQTDRSARFSRSMQPSSDCWRSLSFGASSKNCQHAAYQQAQGITSGEPVQHLDHLRDLRWIHRAPPQAIVRIWYGFHDPAALLIPGS